jgi:hypothetical protein
VTALNGERRRGGQNQHRRPTGYDPSSWLHAFPPFHELA